ncbi:DUF6069 family protein [Nocardioides sp. CFH 31398]|uniref:DUF6069 family protein n=1 Tax=Nocardioides sp. CFH 31398 TaxID=2919579 RepID=UPI001F06ADC1|nr:DUF6069 family protein [Nocardioides sp. CFH 31398]MCH1867791.1 DUF6069 family protein [Nocardioides sp. CFH 31398]
MTTLQQTSTPTTTTAGRVATGIAAAIAAAAVVTTAVALAAGALGASSEFAPLQAPGYVVAGAIGVVAGAVGWAVVRRRARDPRAVLRWLVPTVVAVSLVPDALLLVTGEPGADALGVGALMVMHVLVAAVAVPALAWGMPLGRRG